MLVSCSGFLKQYGNLCSPYNVPVNDHSSREDSWSWHFLDTTQPLFLFLGPLVVLSHIHVYVGRPGRVAPSILGVNRSSDYMLGSWFMQNTRWDTSSCVSALHDYGKGDCTLPPSLCSKKWLYGGHNVLDNLWTPYSCCNMKEKSRYTHTA